MEEIWKDVPGYEGYYQASSLGKVKSLINKNRLGDIILKPINRGNGYVCVNLCKNGNKKQLDIHRVIATTFLEKGDFDIINHIDGNSKNNCVSNLEWCTQSHNIYHCYNVLKRKHPRLGKEQIKMRKRVAQIDKDGNIINIFCSLSQAQKDLGIAYQGISACCNGRQKTAKKFKFSFY